MMAVKAYIRLARPDNWFKNVFVLPGTLFAWQLTRKSPVEFVVLLLIGLVSVCMVASANYVINEWLDREFDKFHPVKKNRPSVLGGVTGTGVAVEYVLLAVTGIALALAVSQAFAAAAIALLVMGFLYNVKPFRTKDRVYLDVLSESVNNPIRLAMGWFIVATSPLPPSSLLLSYWMGGAFLMGVKRYSEFRFIGDPVLAGQYRRSFRFYDGDKLLTSSLFYALTSAFLGGVFLVKYKLELIFTLPFFAGMFAWYFHIGLKPNSAAQHPERMHKERKFLAYVATVAVISAVLVAAKIPSLNYLLENAFLSDVTQ